jgi:hypothetical protein
MAKQCEAVFFCKLTRDTLFESLKSLHLTYFRNLRDTRQKKNEKRKTEKWQLKERNENTCVVRGKI